MKKQKHSFKMVSHFTLAIVLIFSSIVPGLVISQPVQAETRNILFPVIGPVSYYNDYDAPRPNGKHNATDIIGKKHQRLVAAINGTIRFVAYPEPSWGYAVIIEDKQGYEYWYLHMNDDNHGTDDGRGGPMKAYAADMEAGNPIKKGQLVGYMGDSGNAENTPPHLHFEIHKPGGGTINPYHSLKQANKISSPRSYPQLPQERLPYGRNFKGRVSVATGNFDADPAPEIVTGAGGPGGPHVRVFDDDMRTPIGGFFAYRKSFTGGVEVAAGDVDGDGIDEIITGPQKNGAPHVRVFELDRTVRGGFFAYNDSFRKGIHVAAGDIDNDGVDEIITGPQKGGGPHVRAFDLDRTVKASFFAYSRGFSGGVDVASGNAHLATLGDEIITSPGAGGGPHVQVFNTNGVKRKVDEFYAYPKNFSGGVRVDVANVQPGSVEEEIVTLPDSRGGAKARLFKVNGSVDYKNFLEIWWRYNRGDIAAGENTAYGIAGKNRRATLREIPFD